jgi:kynurenine formamidase
MCCFFIIFWNTYRCTETFYSRWKRIAEFPIDEIIFNAPLLLDIPKDLGELLVTEDLVTHRNRIEKADLLLIRSNVNKFKYTRPKEFTSNGPALHSEAAKYLMDTFPNLRAIGVDWISIAPPSFMPDGVYTHQYLLGKHHDHHLFIMEDMNLEGLPSEHLVRVLAFPLLVDGIDSAPATVVAELN